MLTYNVKHINIHPNVYSSTTASACGQGAEPITGSSPQRIKSSRAKRASHGDVPGISSITYSTYMYIYIYVYTICMQYIYICICIYVYMYTYIYIYVYV